MASLLYGKFQLFHRNFSLMENLKNETAMYARLVCMDTVGHGRGTAISDFLCLSLSHNLLKLGIKKKHNLKMI
jgi:hypothetical protein